MAIQRTNTQNPVADGLIATMLSGKNTPKKVDYVHSLATMLHHSGDIELANEILRLGGSPVYAQMIDDPSYKTIY